MARRERTTGLPRPQRRTSAARKRNFVTEFFGGDGGAVRWVLIGGSVLALVLVMLALSANVYHDRYGHGRETVIQVEGEKFSLKYYSERLYQQAISNPNESLGIAEQTLLTKFEEEGVTLAIAKEKGIDLSEDAVNQELALSLGVAYGASGSPFDAALRARLVTLKMSVGSLRKMTRAQLADRKLVELLKAEVPTTGESTSVRVVSVGSQDAANAILTRIRNGEDMAAVAQAESSDPSSQTEGLLDTTPTQLLGTPLKTAIEGKATGELVGPFQVGASWWVARVETRDPAFTYTDDDRSELADQKVTQAIRDKRPTVKLKRDIDSGDIDWAVENLG